MVVDFTDREITNLDETNIGLPMAKAFGEMLMDPRQGKEYSPVRLYEIAHKAVMEKKIDLLSEDIDMCLKLIEGTQMYGALIKAQVMIYLKSVKDAPVA